MRALLLLATAALALSACDRPADTATSPSGGAAPEATPPPAAPRLGLQAWTFRSLTFAETLDRASELGIRYLEIYPGQKLGGDLQGEMGHAMSKETRDAVLRMAADKDVTIVSYGVANGKDEADWRQIFEFANAMGLEWISSEPDPKVLPTVDALSNEFNIRVAIHNHPTGSTYANPDFALSTVEKYGPNIGLCADTGHWARSGYNPVDALRRCMPRVVALHFKDLNEWTRNARDVPWGTGTCDAAGLISVLRKAGFEGVALLEYEHQSPNLVNEASLCAEFFRNAVAAPLDKLVGGQVAPPGFSTDVALEWADSRGQDSKGWPSPEPLLKPDLSNAEYPAGKWTFTDGVLKAEGGAGDLWTKADYGDFVLSVEFRIGEKGNSGVFLRCSDTENWLHNAIEIQILQGDEENDKHVAGAIFDVQEPGPKMPVSANEWHKMVIMAQGPNITVFLDDRRVVNADLDEWTEAGKNPDGTPNKFEKAYKDMSRTGRIGLQDHGDAVEFRNLTIVPL